MFLSRYYNLLASLCLLGVLLCQCETPTAPRTSGSDADTLLYLNHADSAHYVGMTTCRLCHQDIYNTFVQTGMGQSFSLATTAKTAADFQTPHVYDAFSDFHYAAALRGDSMYITEYRLAGKDTLHLRREQVNYIIGSGQHTNSHMRSENGYLTQMPMTFYTQKKRWDLPPGFENGVNTRFSRKIGLECMSCHNGYPAFVMGSENKYTAVPTGIDCERCHGPGSIHVAQRKTGSRIDTANATDYSIVNPSKLPVDAQFDICQRCHLQGNAVLKPGKSFYDFKPGMRLSDFMTVFLPKYKNADDEFIMASHADRLKQSACFIRSLEKAGKADPLKPYKGALTCVTCHNPHVSVRQTNKHVFNEACRKCHTSVQDQTLAKTDCKRFSAKMPDCVNCHMPASGSTDIPHVSVHDHYIRRPVSPAQKNVLKTFLGLFAINEKQPDYLTRAQAYINQYEKFDPNAAYLDSALVLLQKENNATKTAAATIQLFFIRQDYNAVMSVVKQLGETLCLEKLFIKKTYDNGDAWTCYRVGESYTGTGNAQAAEPWLRQAVKLAPYNLEFRNKYASNMAAGGNLNAAAKEFEFILKENKSFVPAYSNLGFIRLRQNRAAEAIRLYKAGELLDPDNEALLLNLAGYYLFMNDKANAKNYLKKIVRKNPTNNQAAGILKQLN